MKPLRKIFFVTAIFLTLTEIAFGAEVRFKSQQIKDSLLCVSFTVEGYKRKDILEAIRRGMEVRITYYIEAVEKGFLTNSVIKRRVFSRNIKYDYWNKAFMVRERRKSSLFQSEGALMEYFFTVSDYPVTSASRLKNRNYFVRIKAELKSVDLYFPMNLIFKYIVGFWDFETAWEKCPPLEIK